ncbi:hypothetical protein RclHR1_09340001 [Rhizophagus clarus]|uniref:Uncharacterized protein n=1 Tax=Rhizophagus clarus TaxID=94130 RepID=A0A2Z6SIB6_9GLOM|nr:hypothetical protein RclHR1_09340001 [Rhizophagus clarus]
MQLLEGPKKFVRGSMEPLPLKAPLLPTFLEIILGRFIKRSRVVTFSNSDFRFSKISLKSSEDMIKPSENSTNDKGKKRKQDHLTGNFENSNLVLTAYNEGEWTVELRGIPVRWFPALWNLAERKQQEKFQVVITNIPDDMTESSLFPNCIPNSFIMASELKSFKIIKEASGARNLSWCRYSTPWFGSQKYCSARIGKAENLKGSTKATPCIDTNFKFSGNSRFHNQNKKDNYISNSGLSNKKNSRFKMNQSNRPDMNKLIIELKALLE